MKLARKEKIMSTLNITYKTGVKVNVEPLLALALVGVVAVVVGDLGVGADVEALILLRIPRRLDHDPIATEI